MTPSLHTLTERIEKAVAQAREDERQAVIKVLEDMKIEAQDGWDDCFW